MFRKKKGLDIVWRCVKNTMSTDEGRRLQSTEYTYDKEGMLESQETTYYFAMDNHSEPEVMRVTKRDAYGLAVGEDLYGKGRVLLVSINVVYIKAEDGLVRWAILTDSDGGTVYTIGHHGDYPGRRGLPVSALYVDKTGEMQEETRYAYDAYGHLVKTYVRRKWDEAFQMEFQREFQYDERGESTYLTTYQDGEPDKHYIIERDYTEDGLCCDSTYLEAPDKITHPYRIISCFLHKYEYRAFSCCPFPPSGRLT